MNCEWLQSAVGYKCLPIRGLNGQKALEVGTPFFFPDGSAITFYLLEENNHFLISDNGDTAMHIASYGSIWNKSTPFQLSKLAKEHHVSLGTQGDIRLLVKKNEVSHGIAVFTAALIALSRWVEQRLNIAPQDVALADEAEIYLSHWKPSEELLKNVPITGLSKRDYSFDYQQGNDLIDIVAPSASSVGATMRKAGDVLNSPYLDGRQIRVIVDDRENPLRAREEKQILGAFVKSMLFTHLIKLSGLPQAQGSQNTLH